MGGIFDINSKFMYFANKVADLMWLNILTLVCCIPIFTIGASLTSLHYVMLHIYRDEESYITKSFFKAFKQNFKQSTVLWLIYLVLIVVLGVDFWAVYKSDIELSAIFKYAVGFAALLVAFSLSWVFVLQSRYNNTVKGTIKNSLIVGTSHFAYSVMMIVLAAVPIVCLCRFEMAVPFVFTFGFSIPAFVQCMLYSRVFDRMEKVDRKAQTKADDGWDVKLEEENADKNSQVDEKSAN